jgi:hypothetical protein
MPPPRVPVCKTCLDVEWVCEAHPDRPWSKDLPSGCVCAAGDPCPDCNEFAGDQPRSGTVITSVDATRDKGRVN